MLAIEGEQSVIADRHAMGIAPEVPEDGVCATKGRLGVDDPVGLEEGVHEGVPLPWGTQRLAVTREVEFVVVVRAPQRLDKLSTKDAARADLTKISQPAHAPLRTSAARKPILPAEVIVDTFKDIWRELHVATRVPAAFGGGLAPPGDEAYCRWPSAECRP